MTLSRILALTSAVVILSAVNLCAAPVQTFTLTNQPLDANDHPISPAAGAGYVFMYESVLQTPGDDFDEFNQPITYTDYFYDYWIENASTDTSIVSWTWQAGIYSGVIQPNPHPNVEVYFDSLPLGPDTGTRQAREELFDSPCAPIVVLSTITWSDAHQDVWPVFIPSCLVPEPTSLIALGGLLGGLFLKRRS